MKLFNNFYLDKKKELLYQFKFILQNIEKILKEQYFITFKSKLSILTNLPERIIDQELKLFLTSNFDFEQGKFKDLFKLKKIFIHSLIFFAKLFYIIIFTKQKKKQENHDLIIDDVTSAEVPLLGSLLENFKSYLLIGKFELKNKYNYIKQPSLKYYDKKLVFGLLYKIFIIFFYTLKISIKEKINLIPFLTFILFRFLKYESLFSCYISKFLLQTRPTMRSSVRNYLFKKNGGKVSGCIQKSLKVYGGWDVFHDTDILFSSGEGSFINDSFLGNRIKKVVPVGSLSLEQHWHKTKKNKTLTFDVVNLGCNILSNFKDILKDKNFDKDYYEQFIWMVKLSKKFPKLRISIKHHASLKLHDNKEIKIIESSNVKRIIKDETNDKNKSYNFAFQSKFVCTWCSIAAYELISLGKPCFFLDPNGKNESFFQNDSINNFWRIKSYDELERRVVELVFEKKDINIKNSNYFCLESQNVSKRIYESFIKYENIN